jgi:ribosomal protein S18 acetylase RimI-like enzyme
MNLNDNIKIIESKPEHFFYFKKFNLEWIDKYFEMEESDEKILNNPEKYILAKGGFIFMAELNDEIVGTCALLKIDDDTFELAKMAVINKAKGKGIGFLLGMKCIEKARQCGAEKIILQSNTILEPAINLYRKLGFEEVDTFPSEYKRSNIHMELNIL